MIKYFHRKLLTDANAAVAAINTAAGYPRRGRVVGGDDSLPSAYSAGAAGWQDSIVSTPVSMAYNLANYGYLMGVPDAADSYLAAAGVSGAFSQCVLLSGQSNATYLEHPDMSAQNLLVTKFSANGSPISFWAPSTFTGFYPLTIKAAARMTVRCIWWNQGETDAGNGEHALYEGRLNTLFAAFRVTFNNPTLPILCTLLNTGGVAANTAAVRTAQINVCNSDPHTYPFDLNAYTLSGDGFHYPAATNIQIGLDMAAATIPLL